MTSDPPSPFKGPWKKEHGEWRATTERIFADRDQTEVKVLSWGPAPSSPAFAKRQEIGDSLATVPHTSVATPEELIAADPRYKDYPVWDAEAFHAREADIIISLHVRDASGAPAEITRFSGDPVIEPKLRVLLPSETLSDKAILHQASVTLRDEHKFPYTKNQFNTCNDIRAQCRRWVEEVRRAKHLQAFLQANE